MISSIILEPVKSLSIFFLVKTNCVTLRAGAFREYVGLWVATSPCSRETWGNKGTQLKPLG